MTHHLLKKLVLAAAPARSPLHYPANHWFTLLLVLISVLGYLSVQRMDEVSFRVLISSTNMPRNGSTQLRLAVQS